MRKFLLGILFLISINLYSDKNKWIRRIPLNRGELILEIRNNSQDSTWNEFARRKTSDFFRALESYSGISFHEASASIFEDQKASEKYKVLLIVQDQIFLNGTRVTGYNNISGDLGTTRGIFMEPDLSPIGYPALLFHELGHFYFSDLAWLSEGLVSFLPFVLYKEKKSISQRKSLFQSRKSGIRKKVFKVKKIFHWIRILDRNILRLILSFIIKL